MKTLPTAMQTALDSGTTTMCHCWMITRRDGLVMGFTDHDADLTFGTPPVTYEALSGFGASAQASSIGYNVDNVDVVGALSSSKITEQDIIAGLYDNAKVTVYRVDWANVASRIVLIAGSIGEVNRGKQYFKGEIRSLMHYLNQPSGRQYRKWCDANFGDSRCGFNATALQKTAYVLEVLSNKMFTSNTAGLYSVSNVPNYFTAGQLTWNDGPNAGRTIEVKYHTQQGGIHLFDLWEAMPYAPIVGNSFTVKPGCDKSIETCKAKYDNVINFRGFPRIPGNDVLARYANKGDLMDGGSYYD